MLKDLLDSTKKEFNNIKVIGCHGSAKAYVAAKIFRQIQSNNNISSTVAAVFPTQRDAIRFMDDLLFFMPDMQSSILYLPGCYIQPLKSLAYHSKTSALRVSILYKLIELTRSYFVITSIDTLLQKSVPKNVLSNAVDLVANGETIDRDLLIARLNSNGYVRTSLVEEP